MKAIPVRAEGVTKGGPMLPDASASCEGMNTPASSTTTNPGTGDKPPRPARKTRLPKLGRHSSGQARATFNGKVEYFGAYGSPEALAAYTERCRQWLASGSRPIVRTPHAGQVLTVAALFQQYREWIISTGRYVKNGTSTSQHHLIEVVLRSFEKFAGNVRLPALREATITRWRDTLESNRRMTRRGINRKVMMLVQAFKWARSRGLLPREVWAEVSAVQPLQRGECGNRPEHGRQRRAVTVEEVERTAAACRCRHVAAMLRFQAIVGCRPGEVGALRWCDLDRNGPVVDGVQFWIYNVADEAAKTAHHGRGISYPVPPAAQAILSEFPGVGAGHVFSPAVSMAERGRARKTAPAFRGCWRTRAYRNAVIRAARAAGVPHFTPHEVRHGVITRVAELSGVLAAQRLAGHSSATTTARYLHAGDDLAFRALAAVAKRIG